MAFFTGPSSEAKRAFHLMQQREILEKEMDLKRQRIAEENSAPDINNKFASHQDAFEIQFKQSTVGLVTLDEMKAKQELLTNESDKAISQDSIKKKVIKELQLSVLSFGEEEDDLSDEEEDEMKIAPIKKITKNPEVDTSFLPDKVRDEEERVLRENLKKEWLEKQEQLKQTLIRVEYSYWDGSGHKRDIVIRKGTTIHTFLFKCLEQLRSEGQFPELRSASVDSLMYVKDDLILSHHQSFYDYIQSGAKSNSDQLLFNFEPPLEGSKKDKNIFTEKENAAGKIALRTWYDKNKHIFPASRWQPYDPERKR